MGSEIPCTARLNGKKLEGKAYLESETLLFRGDVRLTIRFKDITNLSATESQLSMNIPDGSFDLVIGKQAAKWAEKIRNPKSVIDKLGVKEGMAIRVIGELDQAFLDQLQSRGVVMQNATARNPSDMIFLRLDERKDLARLKNLRKQMAPAGMIWLLRPKGPAGIAESDTMKAGREAGLVDVKVVGFSPTCSAEKYVIPVKDREKKQRP